MAFVWLLSVAAVFGTAVQAIAFPEPAETLVPTLPSDGITPKPTEGAKLKELMRRADDATTVYFQSDATCGYLSGSVLSAYTCYSADAQCAIITVSSEGYIGCCDSYECAGFYVDCVDRSAYSSSCDSSCEADTYTLKCTNSYYPYCNSATINGGTSLQVYGYYCNDSPLSTFQPLWTTYSGESDSRSFSPSVLAAGTTSEAASFGGTSDVGGVGGSATGTVSSTTPATPASTPTSTPTSGSSSDSGSSSGDGDSSSGTDQPVEKKKSTNVGAIAGGTVGGVVGLAAIGGIAAFAMLRKKRKNAQQQPPPASALPPTGPSGGPPPTMAQVGPTPPPNGQGYGQPGYEQKLPAYGTGSPDIQYANVPPQPQYYQPPQQPPAAYYPAAGATDPNAAVSPQEYRMSSVSSASGSPYPNPISPQSTGTSATGVGYAANASGQPQVPPTIHEAGGNTVGVADANPNHRGQMHELA